MPEDYIHGFTEVERARLFDQARILADGVFLDWQLEDAETLVELGCGVGAELQLIHERWPHLKLTGVEIASSQIATARLALAELPNLELVQADAAALPFQGNSFDAVCTIWLLEHVESPQAVMREAFRILKPNGQLIMIEVAGRTFQMKPEQPAIKKWWDDFCTYQADHGGDPFVGERLEGLARELGACDIDPRLEPQISSQLRGDERIEQIDYIEALLLSGAEQIGAGPERVGELQAAFERLRRDTAIDFEYKAMRLFCRPPTSL